MKTGNATFLRRWLTYSFERRCKDNTGTGVLQGRVSLKCYNIRTAVLKFYVLKIISYSRSITIKSDMH